MLVLRVLFAMLWFAAPARADGGFTVVKNARNPVRQVSQSELKALFSGRMAEWPDGAAVILVIGSEDSPAMHWLADSVFGLSPKTLLTRIKQAVFHGDMRHPAFAEDDPATFAKLQSDPGMVGLVSNAAAGHLPAGLAILPVR
jgi:ABC-type phosphate transport system substrate-binding protein